MLDSQNRGQATEIDLRNLRETMKIAQESRAAGNHPFGALLAGPDGAVSFIRDAVARSQMAMAHRFVPGRRRMARPFSGSHLQVPVQEIGSRKRLNRY